MNKEQEQNQLLNQKDLPHGHFQLNLDIIQVQHHGLNVIQHQLRIFQSFQIIQKQQKVHMHYLDLMDQVQVIF